MKVVIDVELDDLLEEVENDESGNTYYQLKDQETLKDDIKNAIKEQITNNIRYNFSFDIKCEINKLIKENKNEIVDRVVKEVSTKIIESKAIHDFRKQLKDMETSFIEKVKGDN